MKYGSEETMTSIDDLGSINSVYSQIRNGMQALSAKRYIHTTIVRDAKEETEQYLNFSKHIEDLRSSGALYHDTSDKTSWPSFTIRYPLKNVDGSYMVIKHWMEKHDLFGK